MSRIGRPTSGFGFNSAASQTRKPLSRPPSARSISRGGQDEDQELSTRKSHSNNGMERARPFLSLHPPCHGPQYRNPSPISPPLRNSQSAPESSQEGNDESADSSLSPLCSAFQNLNLTMESKTAPSTISHVPKFKPIPKDTSVRPSSRTSGESACSSKLPVPCTPLTKPKTHRSSSTGTLFLRRPSAIPPLKFKLDGDLTHVSSIADWDPDDKFKDMGNLFDQFFKTVGKANTHHEGVKDALDLYKGRG